jgi:hypothetical protein
MDQDGFHLVDNVSGFGGVRIVAFVDGPVANIDQRSQSIDVEKSQSQTEGLLQILVRFAGAVKSNEFTEGEFIEGLSLADLLNGLHQLLLPFRM